MGREAMVQRGDKATLYFRGTGSLQERWFAFGTFKAMLDRYFSEPTSEQRELILATGDLEYKPAEIMSLAKRLAAEANAVKSLATQSRPSNRP